jgi:DNA-binding CsgD family transcriptional regulator
VRIDLDVAEEAGLSVRDRDVLVGVAAGSTTAEIARRLRLTEDMVKRSVARMLHLWEARDRAQLVAEAFMARVLVVPETKRERRIPRELTERYPLLCRCGRGLAWRDMRRLAPPRVSAVGSATVLPIVCAWCAEGLFAARRRG